MNERKDKTSIIVPVYNVQAYLPACVESLLGQSCSDIEILLVDDGASDGSGALCDQYAAQDSRVKVIHKKNGGLSSARNAGLDKATGQWILFVDGDDYLAKDAVALLQEALQGHEDADFVQFLYQETDGIWQPEHQQTSRQISTQVPDLFKRLYDMGGVAASACTKLFRRELFANLRFKEGILHEDEELMTRLLPQCHKAVYTELVLYGYVTRQGSIIRSGFKPKSMDIFPIMSDRVAVLESLRLSDLATETRRRMFQTAAWQYCLARKDGFIKEAAQLKQYLLDGAKEKDLPLTGQYRLLHRMIRPVPFAPELYYCIRRIMRKT